MTEPTNVAPRSPDGLGERLRELAEQAIAEPRACDSGPTAVWCGVHGDCICDDLTAAGEYDENAVDPRCPLHGNDSRHADPESAQQDALNSFIAACDPQTIIALLDRLSTLTEQVAEGERMLNLRIEQTREKNARIVDLEQQLDLQNKAWKVRIKATREALRSENVRLTKQVRGAERVVEAGRFVLETDAGPVNPMDNNHVVGAGAMADLQRAIDVYHDAALSIYDEGAAGGGRSGSASPAGEGVSGVDAVLHREPRRVE